jgi:hypothetical protein
MERAERRAVPEAPEPIFIGRTRSGQLKRRDGVLITPGPLLRAEEFNSLPLLD